jgi:MFS family permease
MVSTILPLYLVFSLRLSPFEFGLLDGPYQGAAALVRVVGGLAADRWRRYKEVAAAGYALSAVCKLGLLVAGSAWGVLAGVIILDRVGKGVRTGPRDALISLYSSRAGLATSFGVHRALDTGGALLGPLLAFGLLALVPGGFDAVFVASFCAALIGLGMLLLFVENHPACPDARDGDAVSVRDALGLLTMAPFRTLVAAGSMLGLLTISDGFVYLVLQRRLDFSPGFFPLLYLTTALFYLLLAVPAGRLADCIGRGRVLIGGYLLLPLVYLALLVPTLSPLLVLACLMLLGGYYAMTDGVLMALASALLPSGLHGSGLALLATATGGARLLASALFGALWTQWSVETAVVCFVVGLVVAIVFAGIGIERAKRRGIDVQAAAY